MISRSSATTPESSISDWQLNFVRISKKSGLLKGKIGKMSSRRINNLDKRKLRIYLMGRLKCPLQSFSGLNREGLGQTTESILISSQLLKAFCWYPQRFISPDFSFTLKNHEILRRNAYNH